MSTDDQQAVDQSASENGAEDRRDKEAELGRLLPGALAQSFRHGDRLASAMRPAVERALELSVRADAEQLANTFAGVTWLSLRQACIIHVRRMLLGLNDAVLRCLTLRSLRWRVEALRTGRRFSDILRERTQSRRVQQVFLIHRQTGLLLDMASQPSSPSLDGDMVSAMLTAIQDFVHDSFGRGRHHGLESIQVSGRTVCIEQGQHAVLAGVLSGDATPELREVFRGALEAIHAEFAKPLATFSGDTRLFAPARLYLESCVNARVAASADRILPLTWVLVTLPLLIAAGLGARTIWNVLYWRAYITEISALPGIVVVDSGFQNGKFYVRGMRDPMSLDPVAMLSAAGLDATQVSSHWQPFAALSPDMALIRAKQTLKPPDTVSLDIVDGHLYAQGQASGDWIANASRVALTLPGITSVDTSELRRTDEQRWNRWTAYLQSLQSQPGIIVLSTGARDGVFTITGLRDPDAPDPQALCMEAGLGKTDVEGTWNFFVSSHPELVLARARRVLDPPATVSLELENGLLVARGESDHRWIEEARLLARGLAGITGFQVDHLVNRDARRFNQTRQELEGFWIRFIDQGMDVWPGQAGKTRRMLGLLGDLADIARTMRLDYRVEIRGYVRDALDEDANQLASEAIARRFREILQEQDLASRDITTRGMGNSFPDFVASLPPADLPRRCVTLVVVSSDL